MDGKLLDRGYGFSVGVVCLTSCGLFRYYCDLRISPRYRGGAALLYSCENPLVCARDRVNGSTVRSFSW